MAPRPPVASAELFLPARRDLKSLKKAAAECQGCPLFAKATQTIFGEGDASATAVFIGEQPGDAEDIAGHPFVGPAGRLLDKVLEEVGISRDEVYVTNAVKHFKWTPRGKRRLHAKPASREINACKPWLEAELATIQPSIIVCLGATAAQALFGRTFKVTQHRGQPFKSHYADWTLATYHPSAILRSMQIDDAEALRSEFVSDMKLVSKELQRRK